MFLHIRIKLLNPFKACVFQISVMLKGEIMDQDQNPSGSGILQDNQNEQSDQYNARIQDMFVELQKHWQSEWDFSREKVLVEMTEKVNFD